MKIALLALLLTVLFGLLLAGATKDISDGEAALYTFGLEHVPPRIVITAGAQLPDGTVVTESVATGGTVYGTVEADNLMVEGLIAVDGQVRVGNRLWCPQVTWL